MPTGAARRDNGKGQFVALTLGLAAVYVVTARLGLFLALPPEHKATAVWPPSGIALAALLFFGYRVWPGIWVGAFLANLWDFFRTADPTLFAAHGAVSAGIALGSTLQALAGAALLRWAVGGDPLASARRVFVFVGAALAVCVIAASFGTTSLYLGGLAPGPALLNLWWTWWLGDTTGILLFTPLLLAWGRGPLGSEFGWGEAGLGALLALGVGVLVFGRSEAALGITPMAYLTIPLVVWAAVRFGPRGATACLVLVSGLAVWGTANGVGPFVRPTLNESLLLLQIFMSVVVLTALALAGALAERGLATDALKASEGRYRVLTEALPHMVWTMRPDLTLEFLNRNASEFTGYTVERMNNEGWQGLVHPDDLPGMVATVAGPLERGEAHGAEYRFRHHTGEYRWVQSRAVPLKDASGLVVQWVGSTHDLHDRRTAEDRLRQSERRHRALIQATPQIVWTSGGAETGAAGWWSELTGQSAAASAGWGWLDAVHTDDRERVRATWARAYESHALYDTEYRIRTRSGEYRHFAVRGVALTDAMGKVEEWVGTLTDIHDKKEAENQLRELNADLERRVDERTAALRESEQRFRAIFHSQFQFIGLMLPDGTLVEANRTALAAAGVVESDVLGRSFWDTVWWTHDPVQQDRLRDAVRRAAIGELVRFEASHPTPDGSLIWVDFSLTPFRGAGGKVVLLIPEGRDITARKRVEAELRASEERYRLATMAAHVGVWEWNVVTNRVHWNDQMFQMYQIPPTPDGVVTYEVWSRAVFPEDLPREEVILRQTVERLGSSSRSFRIRRPDGECRRIEAAERVLTDAHGRAEWVVGTNLDVTDQYRAEAALRESETLLRNFFEAPGSLRGVVELVDGDIIHLRDNASAAAFFGRTQDELKNRRASQLGVPAEAIRVWTGHYQECARLGRPVQFEFPVPQTEQWLTVSVSPLPSTGAAERFAYVAWDVTDRKWAERALRESEERFRSAFEFAPIGMAMVSTDGRWLKVNRSLCELVGYDERELLATDFQTITHPDDLGTDLDCIRQALDGTIRTYQMEKRYFHKRGHIVHVLLSVSLVRGADGAPLYFISQIKDITQRKQAERALEANEALLRQFIKHSPAAIAMFDRGVRYVQTSDRWLIDYDLVGRDVTGRSHYEVFPDIPDRWKAIHQRVLTGAVEWCAEDPFERADGSTVWLQWECQPWRDAGGEVGGLIMFTQVITERKRAEEALRESEERLRLAMEGASAGCWSWDARVGDTRWDDQFHTSYGFRSDQPRSFEGWIGSIHPDDRPAVLDRVGQVRGTPGDDRWEIEFRSLHPRLGVRWHFGLGRGERNAAGKLDRIFGIDLDITERKLAEEQVRASLREKEVLLKEIHHRVKNNLQIVSALLDLQSGHTVDPQALEMFHESRGRVKSMALIHERLYRSQDLARVNFTEYVEQLADDLYRTYKLSDSDIRLELDVDAPPLSLDLAIPCGLLLNELMSNCFKHAFKGAAEGRLRVSLTTGADGANVLVVSDDGVGFPAGIDFRNTASFGLQLVKTLTEQLDGEIELKSGPGATFTVRFPTTKK